MHPFLVFLIILVVIWTLSGIASVINKQKEQERRARMRMQLERAAAAQGRGQTGQMIPQVVPPPAPRRISEGIAERFPDVLLPPQPAPRYQPAPSPVTFNPSPTSPRPAPPRPVSLQPLSPRPASPRSASPRSASPQTALSGRAAQRRAKPAETVFVLEPDDGTPRPPLAASPPTPAPPAAASRKGSSAVDAASLSRWLKPATLRQQFMLTEVLQPPLALREERRI